MDKKKVKVKITHERNFPFGNKIYGKGGIYEVDHDVGKALVDAGRAEVTEGELPSASSSPFTSQMNKQEFLNMVRSSSHEILLILENEARKPRLTPNEGMGGPRQPVGTQVKETPVRETNEEAAEETTTDQGENNKVEGEGNAPENTENKVGETIGEQQNITGTLIPEGFPGKTELESKGITTLEAIPQDKEKLKELGLNARVSNQIGVRLSKPQQ